MSVTEPVVYWMGSRKECDRTETDGSWEVMDYGGAENVDCEGRLENRRCS